jgi:type IV secretory pathway VirB10-like protein
LTIRREDGFPVTENTLKGKEVLGTESFEKKQNIHQPGSSRENLGYRLIRSSLNILPTLEVNDSVVLILLYMDNTDISQSS